jgi:hypothetical protein
MNSRPRTHYGEALRLPRVNAAVNPPAVLASSVTSGPLSVSFVVVPRASELRPREGICQLRLQAGWPAEADIDADGRLTL